MSDLGDGCPVAVSPAVTTLTTEQPSKSLALSWAFQETPAWSESYKMQKPGATSGVAGLSVKQGQEHSWG